MPRRKAQEPAEEAREEQSYHENEEAREAAREQQAVDENRPVVNADGEPFDSIWEEFAYRVQNEVEDAHDFYTLVEEYKNRPVVLPEHPISEDRGRTVVWREIRLSDNRKYLMNSDGEVYRIDNEGYVALTPSFERNLIGGWQVFSAGDQRGHTRWTPRMERDLEIQFRKLQSKLHEL